MEVTARMTCLQKFGKSSHLSVQQRVCRQPVDPMQHKTSSLKFQNYLMCGELGCRRSSRCAEAKTLAIRIRSSKTASKCSAVRKVPLPAAAETFGPENRVRSMTS